MASCKKHQRAEGAAKVLAIGTAVPPAAFFQDEYPDFYFNITNCNEKTELKEKFARICKNSGINKRHCFHDEKLLKENPSLCTYKDNSLNARQNLVLREVPRLAKRAADEALKEWGQSKSKITHLVFATTSGVNMPGADVTLVRMLGLNSMVKRTMLYQLGCYGGATVLRIAKDLAENDKGARVLTVVSELYSIAFRAPNEEALDNLVGAAIFSDGASVMVIGSDPIPQVERPLYEVHWSGDAILPDSADAIQGTFKESGMMFRLLKDLPGIICKYMPPILEEAREFMDGSPDWNDMFWCVHPGGRAILDELEKLISLKPEKLRASRDVLYDYGNASGASVLFVLNQMRNLSLKKNSTTTGEGAQWGILAAFGPGVTVEVSVLKAVPTPV